MPRTPDTRPGSASSARGQLAPTPTPTPRHPAAHPLRHEVSHESTSGHAQASAADTNPQPSAHHAPQASFSDHSSPALAERIASSLRRSGSAVPVPVPVAVLQDKPGPRARPEELNSGKPPQPWVLDPRRPSSPLRSADRQSFVVAAPRPSNVSGLAGSLAHSSGSHERLSPTPDAAQQDGLHRREGSQSANTHAGSAHGSSSADAFESEEVDLAGLRRVAEKMEEREAHFVRRNGRRLHRHPAAAVPYPRSYDREVVDHDVWCIMWAHQLSGNVAWHLFRTAPKRVLDLGCGTGTWILDAAKTWKDTHFVGLDIVPLHPNLEEIDPILAWRVTWVQANLLEPMPFIDGEFDFVHVRRIARGIPEDKWDFVLEEISRILKPGGAFQISEEDLSFPGIRRELPVKKEEEPLTAKPDVSSSPVGSPPTRPRAPTPSSSLVSFEEEIPPSTIPTSESMAGGLSDAGRSETLPEEPPINPYDHSLLEFIYNEMHAARFINLAPLSLLSSMLPLYFQVETGVRTHPPLVAMFPPPPHESCDLGAARPAGAPPRGDAPEEGEEDLMGSETIAAQVERLDLARREPRADGKTPFVSVAQLVDGSTRYVSVDMARYTAYAPRSLFQPNQYQHKGPPPPLAKGADAGGGGAAAARERLPITAITFDARTLNLQLSLRVQEVLGCAEAMWEFVEAFQARAGGLELPRSTAPSVASSLTGSDGAGAGASARPARAAGRSPQWRALRGLRRADFDALLARFKFDMDDYLAFDAVLEDRLKWKPVPTSRSEERMEFDVMCHAWADYQEALARASDTGGAGQLRAPSLARSSMSGDRHARRSGEGGDTLRGPKAGWQSARESAEPPASRARRRNPVPPHERLSRTIRLFVAFKPAAE